MVCPILCNTKLNNSNIRNIYAIVYKIQIIKEQKGIKQLFTNQIRNKPPKQTSLNIQSKYIQNIKCNT